ncbi:carboxypeptidase Q [Marchantia polymorpha subsp. ruderalis]
MDQIFDARRFRPPACAMVGVLYVLSLAASVALATSRGDSVLALPGSESWISAKAKRDADAIIKEAFSSSTVYDRLAYITDTFGPRLSGSSALESALDWAKDQAQKDGLKVYEEEVKIPSWVRGREYASLLSPRTKNIRIIGLGGSISTPDGKPLVAKALVVNSFDELEKINHQAEGRIVVFNPDFVDYDTTVPYRAFAASTAEKYGAVAVLVRSISPYGLQTVHAGVMNDAGIPAAAITLEDAKMFERMQNRNQDIVIELYMEAHTLPDRLSRNVIIEMEGCEKPQELVVFGGHMDSWDNADGAMDDGGGAFISWEVIRLLKVLGLKPKRTLRAILFVNEENGSKGAISYANKHQHEANLTSLAIESDAGTFTPYGISVTSSKKARAILTHIGQRLLSGIGSGNVSGTEYGEDVSYLADQGVPAGSLQVLDPRYGDYANNPCRAFGDGVSGETDPMKSAYFWYHHTEADTIDKLDPEQLQHCAATMAIWTYTVANLDSLLPR